MNQADSFVVTAQYTKSSKNWVNWLSYSESVAVTFPHLNDRPLRVQQFVEYLTKNSDLCPVLFDPNTQKFESLSEFESFIEKFLKAKPKILLVITNGDTLFLPQNQGLLEYMQDFRMSNLRIFNTFIAFECDLHSKIANTYSYNLLLQNRDTYPLYADSDVEIFVDFLAQKWNLAISPKTRSIITTFSSGSFWLAKEAVRQLRNTGSFDTQHHDFNQRVKTLAQSFSVEEKMILLKAPNISKYQTTPEYLHLKKVGFLMSDDKCRIPLITEPIRALFNAQNQLRAQNREIFFGALNVSMSLSKNENLLLLGFIKKPNQSFTRDEVAQMLWPIGTDEHFSTWAIDQAVKRLRDKLVKIGLPPTSIKSIRGVGYEYRN